MTQAADRLGLSQPATSAILARLRDLFDDPLMLRTPRGMIPTARAESLVPAVKTALATLEQLVHPEIEFDPGTAKLTVSLAAIDYVQAVVLPPLLSYFEQTAPLMRVAVKPINVNQLAQQLERGELDLALMPQGNAPASLRSEVLMHETFLCVVCRHHPTVQGQLSLALYCELEHILVAPRGNDFSGVVDRVLAEHGRSRTVSLSIPNFLMVPELIERSHRIATIPARLAYHYADKWQIFQPPIEVPGFTIALVWHPRTETDVAQVWLRRALVQLIKDLGASKLRQEQFKLKYPTLLGD